MAPVPLSPSPPALTAAGPAPSSCGAHVLAGHAVVIGCVGAG